MSVVSLPTDHHIASVSSTQPIGHHQLPVCLPTCWSTHWHSICWPISQHEFLPVDSLPNSLECIDQPAWPAWSVCWPAGQWASPADAFLADKPKECLRGRLLANVFGNHLGNATIVSFNPSYKNPFGPLSLHPRYCLTSHKRPPRIAEKVSYLSEMMEVCKIQMVIQWVADNRQSFREFSLHIFLASKFITIHLPQIVFYGSRILMATVFYFSLWCHDTEAHFLEYSLFYLPYITKLVWISPAISLHGLEFSHFSSLSGPSRYYAFWFDIMITFCHMCSFRSQRCTGWPYCKSPWESNRCCNITQGDTLPWQ